VGSTSVVLENGDSLDEIQKRTLLTEVKNDALWLIRMVENLLTITRMGGDAEISKNPEALEELVGEVMYKFKKKYPDVATGVSIPSDLVFVPMDIILIEQVLKNLLENSVIHGAFTSRVNLSVIIKDQKAIFSVENNGKKIDPNILPHLFDGYYSSAGAIGRREAEETWASAFPYAPP
jgi:two-component system sensor histidine kinase KdpD